LYGLSEWDLSRRLGNSPRGVITELFVWLFVKGRVGNRRRITFPLSFDFTGPIVQGGDGWLFLMQLCILVPISAWLGLVDLGMGVVRGARRITT